MNELPKLTEEDINEIVYEYYGFTINEIDHSVGYWCTKFTDERTKRKHLEHNWNELKKWLEEEIKSWEEAINEERDYELVNEFASRCNNFEEILYKMQSLKEVSNE